MNPAQQFITLSLRAYRLMVSPLLHFLAGPLGGCRFTPTCSEYAADAVRRQGALRGSWLALRRVGRCHPWGGCGHDPVPENLPSEKRQEWDAVERVPTGFAGAAREPRLVRSLPGALLNK